MYLQNYWEELKHIRWKPIFIPPEHGIWGFTLESILFGFILSYHNHLGISFSIVFLLLLNPFFKQAFKIFLQDVYHKRMILRKYVSFLICVIFSSIYIAIIYYVYQNSLYNFWIWIVVSLLLGASLVYLEIIGYYQHIFVELAGSMIPVLFAISMNSTLEFSLDTIVFIILILGFRNISSILLTREILAILKKTNNKDFFWYILATSIFYSLILYFYFLINLYMFLVMILYLFSMYLLYYFVIHQKIKKAQIIGWSQIIIGIGYVALILIFRE